MTDSPVKPKYVPEDFLTEPRDDKEASERYRMGQARAILDSEIVVVDGVNCYHVELEDGTFADIPVKEAHGAAPKPAV